MSERFTHLCIERQLYRLSIDDNVKFLEMIANGKYPVDAIKVFGEDAHLGYVYDATYISQEYAKDFIEGIQQRS